MAEAFASEPLSGVDAVAFGDLFLEDVRAYREERLASRISAASSRSGGATRRELAREFIAAGFEAIIVCLDPRALDPSFAGRRVRRAACWPSCLQASTPAARTVSSTPSSTRARSSPSRSPARRGEIVERDGFVFCDLLPA